MTRAALASVSVAVALAAVSIATSASATTYAVISLIGRELTIVGSQPQASTHLDRNQYQTAAIADDAFDRVLLAAVERQVHARHAEDSILAMSVSAANVDAASDEGAAAILQAVAPHAVAAHAERIILVAPYRAPPHLQIEKGHIGAGNVSGLGLYVDRMTRLCINGTRQCADGFLGLFANFRIVVADAGTGAVLADDVVATGTTVAAARADNGNPLEALSSSQKILMLQGLVQTEVTRMLPALLAKSGD
jgi:hypothetical protein